MAAWKEHAITDTYFPDLVPEEMGEPLDSLAWPPRVLDEQPFSLLIKQVREPVSQPGLLGGTSLGVGSLVSPISTALEQVTLEPITSPDDAAMVVEIDAHLPELFMKLLGGSYCEGTIVCSMDIAENLPRSSCRHVRHRSWSMQIVIRRPEEDETL